MSATQNNPNALIQDMMETIDALRGVYVRETESLESADTQAFLAIQEEKIEAARKYQEGIERIVERKADMAAVNPLLKKRLEEVQKEFSTITVKNLEAIKRMQRTTERLGNTIRNAAKESARRQRAFSYGDTGALQASDKKTVSMGVSETA